MVASTDTLGVFTDGSASVGWWHGGGAIHLHTLLILFGQYLRLPNREPIRETEKLKNVHYLAPAIDPEKKAQFLGTCDAMLHARQHGETFGLAVGEFAVLGTPVITFSESREKAHLEMLGKQALLYRNVGELAGSLSEFRPHKTHGSEYEIFADPKVVMELFRKKFLEG